MVGLPHDVWPRISEIAKEYGVRGLENDDPHFPILGAVGADGKLYDVEAVCKAIRAKNEDNRIKNLVFPLVHQMLAAERTAGVA